MVYTQLAEEAIKAKLKAHPPYSNFHVGAALLTENNKLYFLEFLNKNIGEAGYYFIKNMQ